MFKPNEVGRDIDLVMSAFLLIRQKPYLSNHWRECSASVVECLTGDRRAAGSSLTSVTALWSLSKTHLSQLSTGSTQEDPSLYN